MSDARGKVAVILSGGGAYGAYEVGVLKALFRGETPVTNFEPLEPDIYTGTSVGSFNATMLTMHGDKPAAVAADELEKAWLNEVAEDETTCGNGVFKFRGNPAQLLNPGCYGSDPATPFVQLANDAAFYAQTLFTRTASFALSEGNISRRVLQFVDLSATISVEPFRAMLERAIDCEAVLRSNKVLRVIATSWSNGEVHIFDNQDVGQEWGRKVIMASAAIPGIFPPVKIDGTVYVDGGVVMNTPLMPAIEAKADTLHIIYLDPDVQNIPFRRLSNTLDTIDRVYTIMQATKLNEDVATAEWINAGLSVLEDVTQFGERAEITEEEVDSFIRTAAAIQNRIEQGKGYRKLLIHRYHPRDDLGGALGMLDFHQDVIRSLIERGFHDAVHHDCDESKCLFA